MDRISDEVGDDDDDDDDDDAATHVIASKDVLSGDELAELAELSRGPLPISRPRTAPPPIPSRVPPPTFPQPPRAYVQPAWNDDGDYDETLNYSADDDDNVPTRVPPEASVRPSTPVRPIAPQRPEPFRAAPVAPTRAALEPGQPFERTAVSPHADAPARLPAPSSDLTTKLLLLLIGVLAVALAAVLVLIARR